MIKPHLWPWIEFSTGGQESWCLFVEGYSNFTPGGIRGKQSLMVKSWTSVRDAIRSIPGASPLNLGGRTWRDEYGAFNSKGPTKSDQERKAWCKVCLHPHLEQGGTPLVERWRWSLFSLLQMGVNNSSLTPLNCILKK